MWRNLVIFCLMLGILVANASEYREATIVRIRPLPNAADDHSVSNTGTATLDGGETYALTISLDDTYYTVIFTRKWKWSFSPSGLAPGDKISVRIEGDKLFMKHAKDKEMKGTIVTARRLGPE
jgi:hypothetical protein